MVPAAGAAFWGAIYSAVYELGVSPGNGDEGVGEETCYGYACYGLTSWGMLVGSIIAIGLWGWVWKLFRRAGVVV